MNARVPSRSFSAEEWQLRCDLAALYRLLAHFRMTDLIYTHISARLPGAGDTFLINRYGMHFHKIRAADLVRIDVDGNLLDAQPGVRVNQAGFTIHSAIHMARPDAVFVIHAHTAATIAVSAQKQGLLPLSQHSMRFHGRLGYHEYEGIAIDLDERRRLAVDLGDAPAMLLRNHGSLTVGSTAAEALNQLYYLERACQIQVATMSCGAELHYPPAGVPEKTAAQWKKLLRDPRYLDAFWNACLQLVETEHDTAGAMQ